MPGGAFSRFSFAERVILAFAFRRLCCRLLRRGLCSQDARHYQIVVIECYVRYAAPARF